MTLDSAALRELAALELRPAVSILMPTHRAGPEIRQDPIRLKTLLRRAEAELARRGIGESEAGRLLGPAQALIEDGAFWRHQEDGLALFAAPNFFRHARVPRRLRERVAIADRFHVVQLVPLVELESRFYVLALSQKAVRLVEATPTTATEVDLGDLPRSLPEALLEDVPDRRLQSHVVSVAGGRGALYHGHGSGMDQRKEQIRQFCHRLDQGLRRLLADRGAPLVLAAVEYLQPLYREANTHPGLLPEGLHGNPEDESADSLRVRAWEVVRPHLEAGRAAAIARYQDLAGTGRASDDVAAVVQAAHQGRVERLFAAAGAERWGSFDPESGTVTLRDDAAPGTEDLVNLAVVLTLDHGGAVHVADPGEMPGSGVLAAVFRY